MTEVTSLINLNSTRLAKTTEYEICLKTDVVPDETENPFAYITLFGSLGETGMNTVSFLDTFLLKTSLILSIVLN